MLREQRKASIASRVGSNGPCLTAAQIAKLEKMAKSPHLIKLLEEMVEEGSLIVQWARHSNKTEARFFSTPKQAPRLKGC